MKTFPFLSIFICLFCGFCLVGLFLLSDIAGCPQKVSQSKRRGTDAIF